MTSCTICASNRNRVRPAPPGLRSIRWELRMLWLLLYGRTHGAASGWGWKQQVMYHPQWVRVVSQALMKNVLFEN